jgi:hypothetical protein
MPTSPRPPFDATQLRSRLAGLRRRLRLVILRRGLGWLLATVVGLAVVAGLLDWAVPGHLPALARAVLLVGTLTAAGLIAYHYLLRPLAGRADDLALALRVEKRYPILNDCLASTVQFLQEPAESEERGSAALRREAVRRGLRRVEHCDFTRVIDRRGSTLAPACLLGAGLLAGLLLALHPATALTALLRLANPFGGPDWPHQTLLDLDPPPSRIGKNDAFEVRGRLRGVVPEKAQIVFQLDGLPQLEQVCDIARGEDGTGTLLFRLDPDRVDRNFTFQVRANDAISPRYAVAVLPPPVLVKLNGRDSPQVGLDFPAYTDLRPADLPDGSGNVEAVAGTRVRFRAAADRPLARAWIEYRPDPQPADHNLPCPAAVAAALGPLGGRSPAEVLALTAGGQAVWDRVPARLDNDRREIHVDFVPRVSGLYRLYFEDDTGLHNTRVFELRVSADPAPVVNLERPSGSRDSLALLPEGEFTLQVSAEDLMYAVRSVGLEYRCNKDESPRVLPLYDGRTAGGGLAALVGVPAVVKQTHVQVARRLALKQFRHPDGSPLKDGDVLTLQAVADDFDDVSVDKAPGRSHEVEIQIIGRNALELALNKEQARIQQELVKLREEQRDALKKVSGVEPHWNRTGKLTPEQTEQLQQAEQQQEQIRERVGPTKEDGLRAEVGKLLDTLKDNKLPRSAVHERMEAVSDELDRLAREELDQIEPRLTNVRKEDQAPGKKDKNLLTEARKHQEEVEKTLNDLLTRLEPWTSTQEIKGTAKSILQEQRQLNKDTETLAQKDLQGKNPDELTPEQKAELDRLKEAQQKLKQRTDQLLEKMNRVADDREKKDPETAKELRNAVQQAQQDNIAGKMQEAGDKVEQNNLNQASDAQQEAAKKLEQLVKALEDRREAELDRLAKKLKEVQKKMDDLSAEQERLQKKVKQAAALKDAKQRDEELKRLAKRQAELKKKAEGMAEELKRLRAGRASQAMTKAADQMGEALKRLEKGEDADEKQEDALDRLDEAQDEMQRAADDAAEQLAREQLAKVADVLKQLKERQEGLVAEAERIQRDVLERKVWDRGHQISLRQLGDAQKELSEETATVAKEKLSGAVVFGRMVKKAARAMDEAAGNLQERFDDVSKAPGHTEADERIARRQQEAVRRLGQLLEAIKPDPGVPQRQPGGNPGGGPGGGSQPPPGDAIPPLAQLKLLRALQAELNKRTEEFGRKHPDLKKLTDKDRDELKALRRDQQEVSELLDEMTQPPEAEGGKP